MTHGSTKGNTGDSHSVGKAGGNEVKCFGLERKSWSLLQIMSLCVTSCQISWVIHFPSTEPLNFFHLYNEGIGLCNIFKSINSNILMWIWSLKSVSTSCFVLWTCISALRTGPLNSFMLSIVTNPTDKSCKFSFNAYMIFHAYECFSQLSLSIS